MTKQHDVSRYATSQTGDARHDSTSTITRADFVKGAIATVAMMGIGTGVAFAQGSSSSTASGSTVSAASGSTASAASGSGSAASASASASAASASASGSTTSAASASASASASVTPNADGKMTPGLYVSTVPSIKGDMTVAVSVDETTIKDIKVTNHMDTPVIADTAIDDMTTRILAGQNVEVDTTAGATLTSMAIANGVSDCLTQAGATLTDFQKGTDAIATEDKKAGDSEDYDIVIVGSGFGGMAAAISAKRAGADKVLVLEKEAMTGGCSRVIGGCISVMNNSTYNQVAGVDCTKDEFIEPLLNGALSHDDDDFKKELLGNVYDVAGDMFSYYYDHDFPLNPDDWYRDYNLGGKVPCFDAYGYHDYTWETGHTTLLDTLVQMATDLGAEIRVNAAVTGLVADGTTVTGVEVEDLTSTYTVNAKKVILATGGFQWNQDLMEKYNAGYASIIPFAAAGCTGDGITMTESLGVPVVGAGGAAGWPALNSSVGWYGPLADLARVAQVALDIDGNNLGSGAISMDVLANTPDCSGYVLYDNTSVYRDRCMQAVKAGLLTQFDSVEDIVDAWGIDQVAIETAFTQNGLTTPPFFGAITHPCNIITFPGIKVDAKCRVQNSDGQTIENLYGAGALVFGNLFEDTADDPGIGGWVGTFSSSCIVNCMGALAAADAAASLA